MFVLVPKRKFKNFEFFFYIFYVKMFVSRFTISKGQGAVFGSFVSENYKGCGLSDQIESGHQGPNHLPLDGRSPPRHK